MATKKSSKTARKSAPKKAAKKAAYKKNPKANEPQRLYEGPREWFYPSIEAAYSKLRPVEEVGLEETTRRPARAAARPRAGEPKDVAFESTFQPGHGEDVLADVPQTHWLEILKEYQSRKSDTRAANALALESMVVPGMPAIAGSNNWVPLGPSVVARGQAVGRPPISGRIPGVAIAPGGMRMYVASANGGVWRSDDAGLSWRSMMDGFDQNPGAFAAASLICGAIAIDPAAPDRVYVGTGEGDTDALFPARLANALPSYRGIGPIRSDDGGATWVSEPSNPSLAGFAFFQIAVDPADREHCVAATTNGLYERVPAAGGGFEWLRRRSNRHSSVVVTRTGGATRWFAGEFPGGVVTSTDGTNWAAVGTGLPVAGRIALAAQPDNPNVVYALVANARAPMIGSTLNGVRRLDGVAGAWANVAGPPPLLPGGQGEFDLCIAVDPNNANLIYMGGDYFNDGVIFPGSIWRGVVSVAGAAYSMATTSIGTNAHSDVHVLAFAPGDSNSLWTGTDGGLFHNTAPAGAGAFVSRNTGLGTLCTNYFGQHPTEPAVIYVGLQDNGTSKCTGEMVWRHVLFADGGYCVVNWNDPFRVMLFANGRVFRCTDGGLDYTSWTNVTPAGAQWVTMAEPVVGAPINAAAPAEANIVALGAGSVAAGVLTSRVHISSDFGGTWPDAVALPAGSGQIYSMIFASAARIFLGTVTGRVFRLDRTAGVWGATRIDNVVAGPLGLAGMVSDIAIDWSDATLSSIFISFGGTGDFRHVWRFNGTAWQARSGVAGSGTQLLDVEHNAIQFDRVTNRLYAGADIGVWESADSGNSWSTLERGLPDAPVFDLQIHPTLRLLRASLHGRGLWEWKLDAPAVPDVELYIRDTMLDTGRGSNTDGRADPSQAPGQTVVHYLSPNIKVDKPTPMGYQTATTSIDFVTFNDLRDDSGGVGTNSPPPTVHNRVYVEVHNRGRVDATNVRVMAAITNASAGLGPLPAGYNANVVAGNPIGGTWMTLGIENVPLIRAGFPQIVHFDLPSTSLPLPASLPGQGHFCLAAFVHSAQDPFTSVTTNVDTLTVADRKVGQKNLHIVEFIGVPPPSTGIGMWAILYVHGAHFKEKGFIDLHFDTRNFPGDLRVLLPPPLFPRRIESQARGFKVASRKFVERWLKEHPVAIKRLYEESKYAAEHYKDMMLAMKQVARQSPLQLARGSEGVIRKIPITAAGRHAMFLRIDPPEGSKIGSAWEFEIRQFDSETRELIGGSRYRVVVNKPAK